MSTSIVLPTLNAASRGLARDLADHLRRRIHSSQEGRVVVSKDVHRRLGDVERLGGGRVDQRHVHGRAVERELPARPAKRGIEENHAPAPDAREAGERSEVWVHLEKWVFVNERELHW